jgi:hypothetical protein
MEEASPLFLNQPTNFAPLHPYEVQCALIIDMTRRFIRRFIHPSLHAPVNSDSTVTRIHLFSSISSL